MRKSSPESSSRHAKRLDQLELGQWPDPPLRATVIDEAPGAKWVESGLLRERNAGPERSILKTGHRRLKVFG